MHIFFIYGILYIDYFDIKHMKKIYLAIIVALTSMYSSSFSAIVDQTEAEQASEFITTLQNVFSTRVLLKIVFTILTIVITFAVAKIIRSKLLGYLEKRYTWDSEIISVITRTVNIAIYITGFSAALGILGLDLGIFMWGIWFGIWFTLKTFLVNFIAGIIMVSQRTYHAGDLVRINNQMWNITKISALFTSIEQFNWVVFTVPNINFLENNVENFNTNDKRRIEIDVMINFKEDVTNAKKVILTMLSRFPGILQAPEPDVLVERLGGDQSGVLLIVRAWIGADDDYVHLKSHITETVNLALKKSNISLAHPMLEISEGSMLDKIK